MLSVVGMFLLALLHWGIVVLYAFENNWVAWVWLAPAILWTATFGLSAYSQGRRD